MFVSISWKIIVINTLHKFYSINVFCPQKYFILIKLKFLKVLMLIKQVYQRSVLFDTIGISIKSNKLVLCKLVFW